MGFPLLYIGFTSFLQYHLKFCTAFAGVKKINTNSYYGVKAVEDDYACRYQAKRAQNIANGGLLFGIVVTIILFVMPPYDW